MTHSQSRVGGKTNEPKLYGWSFGSKQKVITLFLGLLALICTAILFCESVETGLRLFNWNDETEKFVAAQMLNQGLHLYRDIFAHHGPVLYILAQLHTAIVSQTDFSNIRVIVVFFAVASCLAVVFSPSLKNVTAKVWAASLYLYVLSSVWMLQSINMLLYQPIGGFLFVVVLAQMVIPALLGEKLSKIGLFFSGFSLMLTCFSAYSFGPAAVFFVTSTLLSLMVTKENLGMYAKDFFLGIFSAVTIVTVWLIWFGDLIGYLIYHFYFNQKVYASFIGFSWQDILNNFNVSLAPYSLIQTLAVFFLILWGCALVVITFTKAEKIKNGLLKFGAIFFLLIGVVLTNPRGWHGFQNAGFVVLNFAAISLVVALFLQKQLRKSSWCGLISLISFIILLIVFTEQVSLHAISSPHRVAKKDFKDFAAMKVDPKPEHSGIYDFIRSITSETDRILALIYAPVAYVRSGRLPASGHYYYLPWQAAYNNVSLLDYKIDICKDIIDHKPTIIWFDNWKVWGKYEIHQYEPCIPELIKSNYTQSVGFSDLYIRNDIARGVVSDN